MKGIIVKGIGGFYYVKTENGGICECKARGIFRKNGIKPTIGDEVEISSGSIDEIFPRRTHLIRPSVANIDMLVIVMAAANPSPDYALADKLSVAALAAGIRPVICINKTDITDSGAIENIYKKAGFEVISMSAANDSGAPELRKLICGCKAAFAGLSGVGKSSILNLLCGDIAETGEVSRINRGRHTTRHVELFDIGDDTYVMDTPGFSSLAITEICDIKANDLWEYFPEFAAAGECRFKGCSHINEPDCAVKSLVADNAVPQSRYESYKELYAQLREVKEWEKE